MQPAVVGHLEPGAPTLDADQLFGKPQPLTQRLARRLLSHQAVRAALEQHPLRPLGPDLAAHTGAGFEQPELQRDAALLRGPHQEVRRAEPADAPANHRHAVRRGSPVVNRFGLAHRLISLPR